MVSLIRGADRGNAALELVLLAPVILFLIGLVIAAGRTSVAQGAVDAAAREAARQASIAPNESAAMQAALAGAGAALRADGLDCQPLVFLPGLVAAFATQPGQLAQVHARVVCVVRLSDLVVPGVPGSIRLTGSFTSPLDPYRSRNLAVTAFVTPRLAQSVTPTSTKGAGCDRNKARL